MSIAIAEADPCFTQTGSLPANVRWTMNSIDSSPSVRLIFQWPRSVCGEGGTFLMCDNERRGPESNRRIAVLQTAALPLGYRTDHTPIRHLLLRTAFQPILKNAHPQGEPGGKLRPRRARLLYN